MAQCSDYDQEPPVISYLAVIPDELDAVARVDGRAAEEALVDPHGDGPSRDANTYQRTCR